MRGVIDAQGKLAGLVESERGVRRVRYTDHVDDGQALFKAAESMRLEGIVAKRADSSSEWRKRAVYTSYLRTIG